MDIFNAMVNGMTWLLNTLYQFTTYIGLPNYGLAIILLTVLIKLALHPLTNKQMRSMLAMQQLQPKIKEIQAKWKDKDPKKMQEKIMTLYREHNVNPAAGCLPLLIQMPILIALYKSLFNFPFINVDHATFLWVASLSEREPFPYILPILAAATTFLQSRMTMTTSDPTQRMMMFTLPALIGWISATVPAGLALYWVTFNLVGIVQQHFINKKAMVVKEEAEKS